MMHCFQEQTSAVGVPTEPMQERETYNEARVAGVGGGVTDSCSEILRAWGFPLGMCKRFDLR